MKLTNLTLFVFCTGVTLGASADSDRDSWPSSLTIGTGSQGATYYIYGSGWGNLASEATGASFGAEVTGGPVQNVTLVQMGEHEFGMVTTGPAYEAWRGNSELAPGVEHTDIRAVFPMYQTALQVIALSGSGISSISDLDGKTVGIGPAGGTGDMYYPQLFEKLGLNVRTRNAGAADQASQVQDGLLDAFAFAAGIPVSAFSQLEAQVDVNIFSFSEEEMEVFLEDFPEFSPATIPASAYSSLDEDTSAISLWNFAITHKDMPESLVYEVTKAVMENHERMVQVHGSASETVPENFVENTFIPWHPGAVRWFEENGYDIPEELRG
ncbi:TAXI family TRAP transporter solute-binding subunit [Halomonas daqingensis]|uniref:TAXI family TRAP transporter solute-binding subunit n=1 Tax=Billgrantia desiderata TaxID=52021 RepID=UPI001F39F24C|nr:TAXI family TRAP transporter solute-binding subunit [Halomonas desiderata]MCE8012849.1 TAXI family TRAP transporter solute-binding subunit [Halomonas desiderata]MCE8027812.1 TAXI family TRAP transporter solute-binding subunit [Halomonas desiderata]